MVKELLARADELGSTSGEAVFCFFIVAVTHTFVKDTSPDKESRGITNPLAKDRVI